MIPNHPRFPVLLYRGVDVSRRASAVRRARLGRLVGERRVRLPPLPLDLARGAGGARRAARRSSSAGRRARRSRSRRATCSCCRRARATGARRRRRLQGGGRVPGRAGGLRPAARGRRRGAGADRRARRAAGRPGRRRGRRALAAAGRSGATWHRRRALVRASRTPSSTRPCATRARARRRRRGSPTPTPTRPPKKGGKSGSYEDWNKDDLEKRAAEIGIEGRSKMNKDELIDALRNH